MNRQGVRYTAASVLVASLVVAAGAQVAPPALRAGVVAGALAGLLVQVAVFWVFMVRLFPGRIWQGYGIGLLVRFAAFAVMALVVVPQAGLPLAATLFSLVAVFWVTTLIEPAFFKARTPKTTQG